MRVSVHQLVASTFVAHGVLQMHQQSN